jgi:DNA polymerase III delta prime subunit
MPPFVRSTIWATAATALLFLCHSRCQTAVDAFGMSHHHTGSRFIMKAPKDDDDKQHTPHLVLISGSPGTGKSTFAMSVALDQGILKCISTDTIRATMRSFVSHDISPALHRSSFAKAYEGDEDPVRSWRETCSVLTPSVEGLIDDAMKRRTSIVVEGVHVVPHNELIHKWEAAGGVAVGVLLQIRNEEKHKKQLRKRGVMTGVAAVEEEKIASFDRIRAIQEEMMRLAKENHWIQIEQRTAPDPLDLVESALSGDFSFRNDTGTIISEKAERNHHYSSNNHTGKTVQVTNDADAHVNGSIDAVSNAG